MKGTKSVPIDSIVIGARHRKDLGDIDSLARSIQEVGLLHLPAVRPDNTLICGLRRIRAAETLGWTDIDVRVIDPNNPLKAERDENNERKPFTLTEAVEIGAAIEEEEKEKAEERMRAGIPSEKFSEGSDTGRALDKVGAVVGMSRPTYEKAKEVVAHGAADVIAAVDAGEVSVSDAAAIVDLPKKQQREALEKKRSGEAKTLKEAAKAITEEKADSELATLVKKGKIDQVQADHISSLEPDKQQLVIDHIKRGFRTEEAVAKADESPAVTDQEGTEVPERALPAFAGRKQFRELCKEFDALTAKVKAACEGDPAAAYVHFPTVASHLKNAKDAVDAQKPGYVCPYCSGVKDNCEVCKGRGWVTKTIWNNRPRANP